MFYIYTLDFGGTTDVWVGGRGHTDDNYFIWESGVPVDQPEKTPNMGNK